MQAVLISMLKPRTFLMTDILQALSFHSFVLLLYGRGSWGSYQGQVIVFGCVTYSVAPRTSL